MDSVNLKNGKTTKHIIIKRKNKNMNDDRKSNLTILEREKLKIFNEFNINTDEKSRNKNNNVKKTNNSNFLKLFPLQRPKIKINIFSINNNNKRGIAISSEKNNKPMICKVHKSKSKKIKKHKNIVSDVTQYINPIAFNSVQSENNVYNKNTEKISQNKNMNFLNYFNIVQHNNLITLNERLDDLTNKKISATNSSQYLNYINGNKINYNNRNVIQRGINNISEYKNKSINSNIYKKKSIKQKYSFTKIRTNTNSFSELNKSTKEQKVNKQIDPQIFNQLIKNKLKHKKLFKFIPKSNNFMDKYSNESFYTYNYNNKNLNSNSSSTLSSIPLQKKCNKKFINKISIDLEKDDINIYKNNYYICNYINKNNNTYNINNIQNPE